MATICPACGSGDVREACCGDSTATCRKCGHRFEGVGGAACPLNESHIPFGQVPSGSFFRLTTIPGRIFQKTAVRNAAVTEDFKVVLIRDAAPCVVLSEKPVEEVVAEECKPLDDNQLWGD